MIEREILGCFLKDNTLLKETSLEASQFEKEEHKLLFQSMLKLSADEKAIDKVTLLSDNYEYLQSYGGTSFIADIETNGNPDNFESYEKEFIDRFKQRESVLRVNTWLSDKKRNTGDLITELQHLDEIGLSDRRDKDDILKEMLNLPYQENIEAGISSGLTDLDKITGNFKKKRSYVLGARPSMGKTALMLKFALSAMEQEVVPLMFSLEMSEEDLTKRFISTLGNINSYLTQQPNQLSNRQKENWKAAVNNLFKADYEIYDKSMQTIQYIRSAVRKSKRKHEGKQIIVLIDYLTLIDSNKTYQSDHSKFTDISAQLKPIAKDYSCPVITLAQLSRGLEKRPDKRPMLSDLRESGSIEQDADVVMFLYRDSYYNKDSESDELEINVAKNRDGATGTATVYYRKETGKMGNLSAY